MVFYKSLSSFYNEPKQFNELDQKLKSITYFLSLSGFDEATTAPEKSTAGRSIAVSNLSKIFYETLVNEENVKLFGELEKLDNLDEFTAGKISRLKRIITETSIIPADEFIEYSKLQVLSAQAWEEARKKKDYKIFAPFLEKIIAFNKKLIEYKGYEGHPYNALLDIYEAGLTVEKADLFFNKLKGEIVPLLKEIKENGIKIEPKIFNQNYSLEGQKRLSNMLVDKVHYDLSRGVIKESTHPFTIGLHKDDVRITTHYHEDDILSSIYSTIHESGHAIYDQNSSDKIGFSMATGGAYMGIHESQSRLYENNIGRSKAFISDLMEMLKEIYPERSEQFGTEEVYKEINIVNPGLIRIEADELTYSLHVLIRYEIEKEVFTSDIDINELPKLWNKKYKDYLGVEPANDVEGILQDIHWSMGSFGYFATYALGSAYACQFVAKMEEEIDFSKLVEEDELIEIKKWLNEKIHKYGATKEPDFLIKNATGKEFDPSYYTDYLSKKYREIYEI